MRQGTPCKAWSEHNTITMWIAWGNWSRWLLQIHLTWSDGLGSDAECIFLLTICLEIKFKYKKVARIGIVQWPFGIQWELILGPPQISKFMDKVPNINIHGTAFAYNLCYMYFKSSLDYLKYVIKCKWYANSVDPFNNNFKGLLTKSFFSLTTVL